MAWPKRCRSLRALIKTPIKWQDRSLRHGKIYIFYDPTSGHIKIGRTRDSVTRRLNDVKYSHGRPETYLVWSCPALGAGRLYRLEQLVLRNLRQYQKKYVCHHCNRSGAIHHEWFDIGVSEAKRVVMLWHDWLLMNPYHATGRLRDEWLRRVENTYDMPTPKGFEQRFAFFQRFTDLGKEGA